MLDFRAERFAPDPTLDSVTDGAWRNHIILCGLNNLGYRILEQLLEANLSAVVIDDHPEPRLERLVLRRGVPLIREDSRLVETLITAGIRYALALITVEDDDLHNLETVLSANEPGIAPGIRTVASFYNQAIGQEIVLRAVKNARILSQSEIAGPAFVNAALPASNVLHVFEVSNGERAAVIETAATTNGTAAGLFGALGVLTVRDVLQPFARQTAPPRFDISPPHDSPIAPGQRVALIGALHSLRGVAAVQIDPADVAAAGTTVITTTAPAARRRFRLLALPVTVGRVLRDLGRPFRYGLLVVLAFIALGTFIFWQNPQLGLDPVNAFFLTLVVIANMSFGDLTLSKNLDWWVKTFAVLLEVVGATSVAGLYAYITNYIVSRRVAQALGQQRVTDMHDHTIICGLGNIGYKILEGLIARNEPVVVIERDENARFNQQAKAWGVPIIYADSRLAETLKLVNATRARCIAIMTNDDLANIETALNARSQQPGIRVVMRLFDRSLADKIERTFAARVSSTTSAPAQPVYVARSASALAASSYIAAALDYDVLTSFYVERQPFIVARIAVAPDGRLNGMSVGELAQQAGVVVLAYLRASVIVPVEDWHPSGSLEVRTLAPHFAPSPDFRFDPHNAVVVVGTYNSIIRVYRLNITPHPTALG